jgi:hypothetical protein
LKVPIDHDDKESKTYMVKVKNYDSGTPEEFLKWRLTLNELDRYLDFIPIKKTSDSNKITKAYGKSLPEDGIRSIMGRTIPPEWTINLLALGKESWRFKDLEHQLDMYRQQWQARQ